MIYPNEQFLQEFPAIIGVGSYLPTDVVSNEELIRRTGMDSSDAAIQRLTGIQQRHFCNGEFPSEMGVISAGRAIETAGIDSQDIDGIYVSTMTRDMPTPDTAVFMHQRLGLRENSMALDLGGICAGGVMAVYEASNRAHVERAHILAVGLGQMTPVTDFNDRRSGILFGDGAGAFVIGNVRGANRPAFDFMTSPDPEAIHVAGPRYCEDVPSVTGKITMQGRTVAGHAVNMMPRTAVGAAKKAGLYDEQQERIDWDEITAVIPHQANMRLIEKVGDVLEAPADKVIITVDQHGNTSAASIPLAMDQAYKEGRFDSKGPNRVLLTAVGAGMVAGSCIIDVRIPQS